MRVPRQLGENHQHMRVILYDVLKQREFQRKAHIVAQGAYDVLSRVEVAQEIVKIIRLGQLEDIGIKETPEGLCSLSNNGTHLPGEVKKPHVRILLCELHPICARPPGYFGRRGGRIS